MYQDVRICLRILSSNCLYELFDVVFVKVCSLICLVFLTSSGGRQSDYLQLPVAGLLRLLVFSCVAGFLLTGLMIAIRVTQTINMFPINWNMFVSKSQQIFHIYFCYFFSKTDSGCVLAVIAVSAVMEL